jgi:hypothetical protein
MHVPAQAQDNGSLKMTLGVDQRFEAGNNLALRDPPDGDSAFSLTKLRFGLSKITTADRLDFFAGGALRLGKVPLDVSTGFVDPNIGLDYTRNSANALFSIGANYRESDVSFNRSLTDFENEDGVIVLPPDFADIADFGTRQVYRFDTSLQSGLNDPFGFEFDANYYGTEYRDSPNTDFENLGVGASAVFRPGQITTGYIDYDYRRFLRDDAANYDSTTNSISLRGVRSLSETTEFTASFGYSDVETEEFGATSSESNPIGSLGLARQMANGSADALLDVTNSRFGRRVTLVFGRDLDFAVDSLSYSLGVTNGEGFGTNVIGGLNWQRVLPTGRVFARVNRDIQTNNLDEERLITTVALGYEHAFTELSSVLLNASYGNSDFDNTTSDSNQGELSATYRHALTRDWNMDTGIRYRVRNEQIGDTRDSTSLYLSLNRQFDWLR